MESTVFNNILQDLKQESRLRSIPGTKEGIIDFLSNDYLGLAAKSDSFKDEFLNGMKEFRMSSSASRLLSREQDEFIALENILENAYGRPALCFNSGYHANTGIVSALNAGNTLFICDRLVHASVFDGLQMGKCKFTRFRHNDMSALEMLLAANHHLYDNIVVIVESVYSMDGDVAPLKDLATLHRQFKKMILYVDEAHGVGVRGHYGLGLAEETGTINDIDIIVGTFGKALASAGAYVICDTLLKDFFINSARSFIFSTAISPVQAAWSHLMFEKNLNMQTERQHLDEISKRLIKGISKITDNPMKAASQIVPVITGSAERAVTLATALRQDGFDVLPIRRPTVPPKGERIRISLNATHTEKNIDDLLSSLYQRLKLSHEDTIS